MPKLPKELKQIPHWILWRMGEREGKPTKLPVNPMTGGMASTTDPKTWTNYGEAVDILQAGRIQANGLGFVFTEEAGIVGVDLDKCRSAETLKLEPWAQGIMDRLSSYTELSPSHTGLHILVRGKMPPNGNRRGRVEIYGTARYFCMTGEMLTGIGTVEPRQEALD
jgi:primase-polymerase (primpol)-like protein